MVFFVQTLKSDHMVTWQRNTPIIHSLCGFDNVPRAVVIHMVFAANILAVAVVVMTLRLDFLNGNREEKREDQEH